MKKCNCLPYCSSRAAQLPSDVLTTHLFPRICSDVDSLLRRRPFNLPQPLRTPRRLPLPPSSSHAAPCYCASNRLILYGLNAHQTYRYFRIFPSDGLYLRLTVVVTIVAETFYTALCMHICYHYLVLRYFHPDALQTGIWSFDLLTPTLIVMFVTTQIFYVRRVYKINSRIMRFMHTRVETWPQFAWMSSGGFACALGADALLTTMMIAYFWSRHTDFSSTHNMLTTLMIYTVNSGLMTCTLCLCSLILALVRPADMIFVALNICTAHSYATCVLAMINSRETIRAMSEAGSTVPIELRSYRRSVAAYPSRPEGDAPVKLLHLTSSPPGP
ncbi:hypothetical protein C8Q80DRAFT_665205 [Daedaleopsis nitida]|nr:hypothetical protein C8Q80DRAFT_665205 [Daedaleopsis nitida]